MRHNVVPSACAVSLQNMQSTDQSGHVLLGVSASELHVLRVAGNKRRGALITEIAADCGLSENAAAVRLRRLKNEGFLARTKYRTRGHVKFFLTDQGRQALKLVERTRRPA